MSGDPFRKVRAGERITSLPAEAWNAFIDAAKRTQTISRAESRPRLDRFIVPVKNNSEDPIARFGVLGITASLIDPATDEGGFLDQIALQGDVPSAGHYGRFAVAVEPIDAGAIGLACVGGVCIGRVYIPDEDGPFRFADIDPGETEHLKARVRGGASILWHEAVADEVGWAILNLTGASDRYQLFPITLTVATTAYGSTTTATAHTYDVSIPATGEQILSGEDIVGGLHVYRRPSLGRMTVATAGLAYYDDDAELIIASANEAIDPEVCK